MRLAASTNLRPALTGLLLAAIGSAGIALVSLAIGRDAFEVDARIVHRVLSQRVVQHDAILSTLAQLQPGVAARGEPAAAASAGIDVAPEQRLLSVYPQLLQIFRRDRGGTWPASDAVALAAGETASRSAGRAALAAVDLAAGHYLLVRAAEPASFALRIDLRTLVGGADWPLVAASPVQVRLVLGGQALVLHPGRETSVSAPWRFDFNKALAADSQPFEVVASLRPGWAGLPWLPMAAWCLLVALGVLGSRAWSVQRAERRRAQELVRLGQVARLNTLGELAAGMAHELNQPLTALLAGTQAAQRLLDDDPPDIGTARGALTQAALQARRAADVVGRLRRLVERPQTGAAVQPVALDAVVHKVLDLLAPDCAARGVVTQVRGAPLTVLADPVAVEQIVHNLLTNALQALEQVSADERRLALELHADSAWGVLVVCDSGPGFAAEVLPRIFEPFFSTRSGGLGLGLSLSETLVAGMGGSLRAANRASRGAELRLQLPLAGGTT